GGETLRSLTRPDPSPQGYPYPEVIPNPLQIPALAPYQQVIGDVAWTGIYVSMALAALSLVLRLRRADPVGRRQIGWPLFAFVGYIVFLILGEIVPGLAWAAVAWCALIPITVAFSVLRYRLYGID